MPELKPGDRVWVKATSDLGSEGVVDRLDHNPNSYWVMVGAKVVKRNRKHLFLLLDRKSTRLNSSHVKRSRMPSSA